MRFNKTITLVDLTVTQRANGSFTETRTTSTVFANPMTIGMGSFVAARAAGLHADASVQVRSCDYSGQEVVVMDSVEYDVEDVSDTGELTRLTLAKRAHNTGATNA